MICPSTLYVCISHLLYNADLLHKKAGAFTGESGSCSGHREILTGAASADDVHGRQCSPVQLCDIPNVDHVGEMALGDFDGKGFDLAGPYRSDPASDRRQWKPANAIEEASHGQCFHFPTAAAMVLVVLMAVWAV